LWRKVVPDLSAAGLRCLAVDWPLGSHSIPVPGADLTPPGLAALIAEFLEALDLHDVTIVANDTGGALTQILITTQPERVARVVLTPCDSFERFFPPLFAPLTVLARVPGAVWLLAQSMRLRFAQRLPIAYGWLAKKPIEPEVMRRYLGPIWHDRRIRRDAARVLRSVHRRYTLAAAQLLPRFDKPVLIVWAEEDRVFPFSLAQRLARTLPNAQVRPLRDSYTFVPEDQPGELVDLVLDFVWQHAAA
ncbi:MAG: hypothetical protein QOG80_812, partial [Pseudonocardiales bacterium]|nr:hypothetical protein [Pseudonocardiales bacterium]